MRGHCSVTASPFQVIDSKDSYYGTLYIQRRRNITSSLATEQSDLQNALAATEKIIIFEHSVIVTLGM